MPKLAFVHDDFMQWGGAERLVAALAAVYPDAPIYTSMLDESVVAKTGIDPKRFIVSWLDKLPWKDKLNKVAFPLYPMAFEAFDFSGYEVVVSSSTRFAHSVLTKPDTKHIAYINSPFRGFWEPDLYFGSSTRGRILKTVLSPMLLYLRGWDYIAAQRPDIVFANSTISLARVKKYYQREGEVFFPFVDFNRFDTEEKPISNLLNRTSIEDGEYYVLISRLVDWKKFDIAIDAFNQSGRKLLVIGQGPHFEFLKSKAGSNVWVLGFVSDAEVSYLLRRAKALIHPQKEDFGMTVVEANYCGVPAVAFNQGGALDTVIEGQTGVFFDQQTPDSINQAIERLEQTSFSDDDLRQQAQRFSKDIFIERWQNVIADS